MPNSKAINGNNVSLDIEYMGINNAFSGSPASNEKNYVGLRDFGTIKETLKYIFSTSSITKGMNPKILKQVDLKLDDGLYWNGRVRASCFGKSSSGTASDTTYIYTDYDYAIENNKKCFELFYAL